MVEDSQVTEGRFLLSYDVEKSSPFPSPEELRKRVREFYARNRWRENPFAFDILPEAIVGYEEQRSQLLAAVERREKIILILGPTGSGKTTMLKWLENELRNERGLIVFFMSKAPRDERELIEQLNHHLFNLRFLRWIPLFKSYIRNTSEIVPKLRQKFGEKRLIMLVDEAHEAGLEALRWMRVIGDHANITIVFSALPVFEEQLQTSLETLRKRVSTRIILRRLERESEVKELIEKRIRLASDGEGKNPFTENAIRKIFEISGGFPREVLRLCNRAVSLAAMEGKEIIDESLISEEGVARAIEAKEMEFDLASLPKRKREVIEAMLSGATTPAEILEKISLKGYKSREHALRSINNILKRMLDEGLVVREPQGKTFVYSLSPRLKTLLTKA